MRAGRRRKLTRRCTISRAAVTGQSGSTVASDVACTPAWPAGRETRTDPELATISALFEMQCEAVEASDDDQVLLDDGRRFAVRRAQRWESRWGNLTHLVLEEKRRD